MISFVNLHYTMWRKPSLVLLKKKNLVYLHGELMLHDFSMIPVFQVTIDSGRVAWYAYKLPIYHEFITKIFRSEHKKDDLTNLGQHNRSRVK